MKHCSKAVKGILQYVEKLEEKVRGECQGRKVIEAASKKQRKINSK